jgi:hypothetical protein
MSPDDSDEHHVTLASSRRKKKGKSKLATSVSAQSRSLQLGGDESATRRGSGLGSSTTSRREESRSSRTLGDGLEGHEGTHFEGRFNASSLDPSTAGIQPCFDNSEASSSSTRLDEDEDSETDDLHDTKGNPSDDSPYAQVRASVSPSDNTSLSIDTPRMWFLSIIFAIAGSSTNLFFSLRYPSVSLTPIIALLLVHPLGLLWDQIFKRHNDPEETFVNGCLLKSAYSSQTLQRKASWKRTLRLWLAQGRWNEKEHCCVYVSSNVSFGFAFATDVSDWRQKKDQLVADTGIGHCRTSQVLPSRPWYHISNPPSPLDTDFGLLIGRSDATLPRPAQWHDMASYVGIHRYVHRIASGGE